MLPMLLKTQEYTASKKHPKHAHEQATQCRIFVRSCPPSQIYTSFAECPSGSTVSSMAPRSYHYKS